jgi:methyl-accepting chemotaxis protein
MGTGFASILVLTIAIAIISIYALKAVVADKDLVINVNAKNRIDAENLDSAAEGKVAAARGYILTRNEERFEDMREARLEFKKTLEQLKSRTDSESSRLVNIIEEAELEHQKLTDEVLELCRGDTPADIIAKRFDSVVVPQRHMLKNAVGALVTRERDLLEAARRSASDSAASAMQLVWALVSLSALVALGIAVFLTRTLTRQVGSAVLHVQSSSSELQSAASQQATGAKEQATSMSEITTTISELLATSRQIAESAQRVTGIAEETARTARVGEQVVGRTGDSIVTIKRQVDLIVTQMLDLGRKSQQIGGILEVVNELAEQTNILAINATIEAAGAGESGKRFAVVADEIRKLADRVGGSTKEIRGLIEEIRAAVNTTVMTTESGSKAVDAGTRNFSEVAVALKQIVNSVGTTMEAAREIELSTKQQSTAVEQVNAAISNAAQATRETEASANQTQRTAEELTGLSMNLLRLIQSQRRS